MSRRVRRLVAGGVTVVLATIGAEVVGTADAFAHNNAVTGTVSCQDSGTYTVTWSIANDYKKAETVTASSHTPSGAALTPSSISVGKNGTGTMTESGISGSSTSATLTVHGKWSDGFTIDSSGAVNLKGSCNPTHAPTAPSAANGKCGSGNTQMPPKITIPADSGVGYKLDGSAKSSGTYPVTAGTHTVKASSSTLTLTGTVSWTFDVTAAPADCNDVVTPAAPSVSQSKCVSGSSTPSAPTLTFASTSGITYSASPAGSYAGGQPVTVTATAGSGSEFTSPGKDGWTYVDSKHETYQLTFDAAPTCAEPTTPTFTDDKCVDFDAVGATYTIPTTTGVDYVVNGSTKAAGTYPVADSSTLTITAQPRSGYTLTGTTTWTYSFADQPRCTTAETPAPPSFSDDACVDYAPTQATYTIPSTPGVDYFVDAVKTAAGTYDATDGTTITVTTQPQAGFTLSGTTTFTHTFTTTPTCTASVTPVTPTFHDPVCSGIGTATGSSYTIPVITGVQYLVNGGPAVAGNYDATPGSTVVVTVQPLPGYALSEASTWTHSFPTSTPSACLDSVVAAAASFTNPVCNAGGKVVSGGYTVPQTTGVVYEIQGATVAAGTYPADAGSTITIAASAKTGYQLSGITQWTHTFTAPKQCLDTAGTQVTPPTSGTPVASTSSSTAYTGTPVEEILLTGITLILLGTACFAGAAVRRRRLPAT